MAALEPRTRRRSTAGASAGTQQSCCGPNPLHRRRRRRQMAVLDRIEPDLVRQLHWDPDEDGRQQLSTREWIVTNGLGGYATGTIGGTLTRRYHGLLVAALATPFGRTVMLNYMWE